MASADRPLLSAARTALKPFRNQTLLVGVSGGPDSLCLLHLLTRVAPKTGVTLHVAHLDHALRPESAEDATFVERIALEWGIAATVERRPLAKPSEDAARKVRYRFFADIAKTVGAAAVAVGHTAGDQAETVLLHLVRGSGLTGLAGMSPDTEIQGLRIVRPLLSVHRAETLAYCQRHGIAFLEDPSNRSPKFTRNRIRSELLPLLRELNPRIENALLRLAGIAQDEEEFWQWFLSERRSDSPRLSRQTLDPLPRAAQTRLLIEAHRGLTDEFLEATHIHSLLDLLKAGTGKQLSLPGGIQAETEADALVLRAGPVAKPPSWSPTTLRVPGETIAGPWKVVCAFTSPALPAEPWSVVIDIDQSGSDLTLRPRHPGDRYRPTGMPAPKKLQDILVDAKVPRRLRDTVPILEGPSDILWVGSQRVAEEAKVTDHTSTALQVRLEPLTEPAHELASLSF